MKYSTELIIKKNQETVIDLFSDFNNRKKWEHNLLKYELIQGQLGEDSSQVKLYYRKGTREKVIIETVEKNDLPITLSLMYQIHENKKKPVHYSMYHIFFDDEFNTDHCLWIIDTEIEIHTLGKKITAYLLPWFIKNQTKKYMQQFKEFAEKNIT